GEPGPDQRLPGLAHAREAVKDRVAKAEGPGVGRDPVDRVEVAGQHRECEPGVGAELPASELLGIQRHSLGLLGRTALGLAAAGLAQRDDRSEEHTSELQSRENLVCRLLLEKKKAFLSV